MVNAKFIFSIACIKDIPSYYMGQSCRDYHQVVYSLYQNNLQKLCNATELTMGTWFTEKLMAYCVPFPILLSSFQSKTIRFVEVLSICCEVCISLLLLLFSPLFTSFVGITAPGHVHVAVQKGARFKIELQILQSIKYIVPFILLAALYFIDNSRCNSELRDLAKGDNMDLQNCVSSLEFHNLKNVKIVISSKLCLKYHVKWGFKKLFKLSKFLLINASVLEKFIIISKRSRCETCSGNCLSKYLFLLAFKLLDCPRSSTNSSPNSIKLKWMVLSKDHIVNLLLDCSSLETME
ncbi:hypothetical protein H5410_016536 [Solanum commersonii]|uniref:Uncharacterized protein n=1 Tax=Solanum commersonii TaxID=4109 RepID=A0A9J5ZWW0_SOLCO|nr:hypothetical protein H5410_016536 [Solanum commersonii]